MSGYILSPDAENDVFEIWSHLAQQVGIQLANQIESELFDDFELLARNPGLGHLRQDLIALPVFFYRAFPYQYMIAYRKRAPLEIVAVLHAKRNIERILSGRKKTSF